MHLVSIETEYQTHAFVVSKTFKDTAGFTLLAPGDRITKIQNLSIPEFFNQGGKAVFFYQPAFPITVFPEENYRWPAIPTAHPVVLFSVGARWLTIIPANSNSNQTIELDLEQAFANKRTDIVFTLQFFTAVVFWLTGFILWWCRPDQLQTLYFNLFFGCAGLYVLAINASSFSTDYTLNMIHVLCCFVVSLSFPLLALYFPGEQTVVFNARLKLGLLIFGGLVFGANALFLIAILNFRTLGETIVNLAATARLLLLTTSLLSGVGLFFIRSVKSRGLVRVKLQLVCISLLLSLIPTALTYIGYYNFGWFSYIINNYSQFLLLPIVIFPLGFLYAIFRHRLFYPEKAARSLLAYIILIGMLLVLYVQLGGFISFLFDLSGFERSWYSILLFVVLVLVAARMYNPLKSLIDRLFYRNKLNYHELLKKWVGCLTTPGFDLTKLITSLTGEFRQDFQYQQLAVVLLEDVSEDVRHKELETFFELEQQSFRERIARYRVLLFSNSLELNSLPSSYHKESQEPGLIEQLLNPAAFEQAQVKMLTIPSYEGLPFSALSRFISTERELTLVLERPPAELLNLPQLEGYQFFLPFPFGEHRIAGGIVFGNKLSAQGVNQEERHILAELVDYLALTINCSVLSQAQTYRKQVMQTMLLKHDEMAEREQQRIALDIHDTVAQDYQHLFSLLGNWLASYDDTTSLHQGSEGKKLIEQAYEAGRTFHTRIRTIIKKLHSDPLEVGLLAALEDLVVMFKIRYEELQLTLNSELSLEQEVLLKKLSHHTLLETYRIVQEALVNALKHSDCRSLGVRLFVQTESGEDKLVIEVWDDGRGFSPNALGLNKLLQANHFGLNFMQIRVNNIGGQLFLKNRPGGGALVQVLIPLETSRLEINQEILKKRELSIK